MSFDLTFWHETPAPDPQAALATYERLMDGVEGVIDAHPAVRLFQQDLLDRWGDLTEENEEAPWTAGIWANDECVAVGISWSRCAEVAPELHAMASRRGLVTFDPQDRTVLT